MVTRNEAVEMVMAARKVGVFVRLNEKYDVFCVWADPEDVANELELLSPDTMVDARMRDDSGGVCFIG